MLERSAKLQQRFNPNHAPAGSPEGGQFTSGGGEGGGGGEAKPGGGEKTGGKAKVSKIADFNKKGIRLDNDTTIDPKKAAKFIQRWNDRVGEAPEDFKNDFVGVPSAMTINYDDVNDKMYVSGQVKDEDDQTIGDFDRHIDLKNNSAYSAYFKLNRGVQGGNIGKTLLASNVAMYQKMGINQVRVSANIDVGGYAWAKYGYVPTQASWNELRSDLRDKLTGDRDRSNHTRDGSGYTPEEWDAIGSDDQASIESAWMRSTFDEFYDSEVQNWRESGQALQQAKTDLVDEFNSSQEKWALAALQEWRNGRKDEGAGIPYSNEQILEAFTAEDYHDRYDEGKADPEFSFDPDKLKDEEQPSLPGLEAEPLSDEAQSEITDALTKAFNDEAENNADRIDAPDYIRDNVGEYQQEYWSSMDDDDKYRWADRNGELPEYPLDDDEEAHEPLDINPTAESALMKLVNSSDPKSIWAIADSSQGKQLLLNTSWSGVLNLKDKQTMDRFHAYVGKKK